MSFPVTVLHVSRRWRTVAPRTPTIWFYLRLTGVQSTTYLSTFVERFLDSPLDIVMRSHVLKGTNWTVFLQSHEWRTYTSYMVQLLQHVDRWRRFSLFASHAEAAHASCSVLKGCRAARLHCLQIWLLNSAPLFMEYLFLEGKPSLEHVRLTHTRLAMFSPPLYHTLMVLFLYFQARSPFPHESLQTILSSASMLARLYISCIKCTLTQGWQTPVNAPALRELDTARELNALLRSLANVLRNGPGFPCTHRVDLHLSKRDHLAND
ncbi:uncharacterized protein LAESUDRAFT_753346 [Laetiporus sulphureus 93-53]|uniref:F-box domain-containing protein n=1 Tax=Laetiporus sulphureus 93-53 TaxID=1314785 RepID=A0A165B2B7_9APHY|nr:uncharacterized protein LAESUDRAFT_753346 [Laetiporus sulphureus 93-53]KZT00094.1 hypothetical protein LAESUDRAFT_753346 [Laetiporus sulphureus 93-53]